MSASFKKTLPHTAVFERLPKTQCSAPPSASPRDSYMDWITPQMHTLKSQRSLLQQLRVRLTQNPRPPKLSEAHFNEAHECFERASDQQLQILDWLKQFAKDRTRSRDLNILSVGCGSGILDNPFLEALARDTTTVRYVGLDPSPVACRRFEEDFRQLRLSRVQLELHQTTLENFQTPDSFDLIHSVQSLYYVDEPSVAIGQLFRMLNSDGYVVVMLAPRGAMNRLAEAFWTVNHHDGIWFSDRFENYLHQIEVRHERSRLMGWLNVTPCFEANSRRGNLILDFITQVNCQRLTEEQRELSLDYLQTIVRRRDEQWFVPHPVDVFVMKPVAEG